MASFRSQSTEIPVSLQNESRKGSFRGGKARSSAKTGAAMTSLPRASAASKAERASVFRVSSSFQRATKMLESRAVVMARAGHEAIGGRLFCRERCRESLCLYIFQTGSWTGPGERGLLRRGFRHGGNPRAQRGDCRRDERRARGGFREAR